MGTDRYGKMERITCSWKLRDRVEKSTSSRIEGMVVGKAIMAWG